ncbi:1,25-dihydroxyvitamin D(3) 24-hydroxylase, mitochondrial-like [Glandiceps talaboti]
MMYTVRVANGKVLHVPDCVQIIRRKCQTKLTQFMPRYSASLATSKSNVDNLPTKKTDVFTKSLDDMPGITHGIFGTLYNILKQYMQGTLSKPWLGTEELHQKYGSIFKKETPGMGQKVSVFLCEPRDFEMVLRNEGRHPKRFDIEPWILYRETRGHEKGLLLMNGPKWHRNRSALGKRLLRPKHVSTYTDGFNDVTGDLMTQIDRTRQADYIVPDLEDMTYKWALDSSWSLILDKRMNSITSNNEVSERFIKAIHDMMNSSTWLFITPSTLHKKYNTRVWRKHMAAWDVIFDIGKTLIDEKMEKVTTELSESKTEDVEADFLTYLVSQEKLTLEELYANTTELLLAAVDTTSNGLLWVLYHLANQPEIQQKLYEEVNRVVPKGERPTYKHITEMSYLKAVLKESMRVNPVVQSSVRILEHDIVIQGYRIPAQTAILYPSMLNGHSSKYFENPEEFRPERWLREDGQHFDGFRILPFGFGPRSCIGKRLAELEIHLALTMICRKYKLERTCDVEPKSRAVIVPDRPLNLKMIAR